MESDLNEKGEPFSNMVRERFEQQDLIGKLSLAHELALFDQVKTGLPTEIHEPSLKNSIEIQMRQAFWDAFQSELNQVPVKLDMALVLLEEIKLKLISVMTPNVKKMKADVNRILDPEIIKEKIEDGTFFLEQYANYVISVMKRICAPIRDSNVLKLSQEKEPIAIFRGIIETLDLMKIDLINYTLSVIKPVVVENDMEYERTKLTEYISRFGKDLQITRNWLKKHKNPDVDLKKTILDAYMDLLKWPNEKYPETLVLDFSKITYLKNQYYKVILLSSIMFVAYTFMPTKLNADQETAHNMKRKIKTLLTDVHDDHLFKTVIPDVVEHIKEDVNKALKRFDKPDLTQYDKKGLFNQLESLTEGDNKIKIVVENRVRDFLRDVLNDKSNAEIPTSLRFVKEEISALSSRFAYIVGHNFCVCSPHYASILQS